MWNGIFHFKEISPQRNSSKKPAFFKVKDWKEWLFLCWLPTDLKFRTFFIIAGGGCWFERTIVHEFIHAFGFHHEQVRPDRDNYVEIIYENIPVDKVHNFNLFTGSLTFGVDYDGYSVMHYGSKAFTTNSYGSGNTIESKVLFELMHKNDKFAWPFACS